MRATELYRHFDKKGKLLYVGVSISTLVRLGQHRDNSVWFTQIKTTEIEHFDTREAALIAEQKAIQNEQPQHNVHHKKQVVDLREARIRAEESRADLTRRLVKFDPVYSLDRAAEVLSVRSGMYVLRLIEAGQLGFIQMPPPRPGGRPKLAVSGWQLLEYIEALEAASAQPKVA